MKGYIGMSGICCAIALMVPVAYAESKDVNSACVLMRETIGVDEQNDRDEVLKLQVFLQTKESLPVALTGVYDPQTVVAVRLFQRRYASEILAPWGLSEPTGFVGVHTIEVINRLYCGTCATTSCPVVSTTSSATSSSLGNRLGDMLIGSFSHEHDGGLSGTPVGFVDELSLPILIVLGVTLSMQTYFLWGLVPSRRMALIPEDIKRKAQ